MFSPSLLLKLIVPYVTALSLIAFALLYAVPKQQKAAFLEDVTGQLKAISQTAAEGVEIAIEEEDFSSLSIINRLLESNPNVTFAAIYIEEDGHSEQFAIYPSELAEDAAFSVDEDRYLIHKYPVETPLLKGNVWVGYDKTLFEQQTLRINTPVYLSFIFILLILLFSYRTIARSVVKPIREAAKAADAMSSGRLESSLDLVSRPDEIGILHKSLQNLQVNLSDQRKENQELMASLEDRVRSRTAEL
ncbi:MAG: HAMP domain-containing protein, partial [Candidatus Latescibacterota bacterium]